VYSTYSHSVSSNIATTEYMQQEDDSKFSKVTFALPRDVYTTSLSRKQVVESAHI